MRIRSYLCGFFLGSLGCLLLVGGCDEQDPTGERDQEAPVVSIVHPLPILPMEIKGALIEDSTNVVIAAADESGVSEVQIWLVLHTDSLQTKIGPALTEPDSAEYFSYFWRIGTIDNGSTGALYAIATDAAGNSRASEQVPVQIINQSLLRAPFADFSVVPSEGTVDNTFTFDPSPTRDQVVSDDEILVRWDFQNDGSWDFDLADSLTAGTPVQWKYARPDSYKVTMQAFNKYYSLVSTPNKPDTAIRSLFVLPAEGIPRPPRGYEHVPILPDSFAIGALDCESCGLDDDEALDGTLFVKISTTYYIGAHEVTNRLYTDYLDTARVEGKILFDPDGDPIVYSPDGSQIYLVLDESLTRVRYSQSDSTFYADDTYIDHPVTGVSWYGATAYANFYGLRLPSEIEWEIAARGKIIETGPFYPWALSETIDGSYANFRQSGDPFESGGVPRSTTPVKYYNGENAFTVNAISPMETYDQAGNVSEWSKDWYSADLYHGLLNQYLRTRVPPVDPEGPPSGTVRALRGGSHDDMSSVLRVTNRMSAAPETRSYWIGFRTAYTEF
ncbi:MAG: SUMF1/EgtB/PvdO family nonheme iron enzyme [Candidatus Eisenbacteria bacterium]